MSDTRPAELEGIAKVTAFKPKFAFPLQPFDQIRVAPSRNYLVNGIVPREGLTVVWGPPKCGKTFWVFDLAMHVALGRAYRGRRVQQGTVVYVALEGERGLAQRAEAFRREKMAQVNDGTPFYLLCSRLDLAEDAETLVGDVRAQLKGDGCAAVVIDTLNRSLGGSESSDEDMGAYVKAADRVREALRCAVIVIHHSGVDKERPRGHTSLTGAADAQIRVRRDAGDRVVTTVEWMKDGPEGATTASILKAIEVGTDEDGEPITSCVVVPEDEDMTEPRKYRPSAKGATKVVYDALVKALEEGGQDPSGDRHVPDGVRKVVKTDLWREYAYRMQIAAADSPEARRRAFARAVDKLHELDLARVWRDWAWTV